VRDNFKESQLATLDKENPHSVGGDLKISLQESIDQDNPERYFYWVKVGEPEKDKGHEKGKSGKNDKDNKLVGSMVEVQSPMMAYVPLVTIAECPRSPSG
jgi:hypothetical protein